MSNIKELFKVDLELQIKILVPTLEDLYLFTLP